MATIILDNLPDELIEPRQKLAQQKKPKDIAPLPH